MSFRALFPLLAMTVFGCRSDQGFGEDGADDPKDDSGGLEEIPADSGDSGNDGEDGIISGTIQVEVYKYDEMGDLVWQEWSSVYGDDFPFGSIFVSAYALDEETFTMTYVDQYVIRSPDPEGNSYELQVDPELAPQVRVYAVLDYWADGIIATYEPMGVWPDVVDVVPGAEVAGVDIDIPVFYYDFATPGGGGGWNRDDYVLVTGEGLITEPYAGGSCMALFYGNDGYGPYWVDGFTPTRVDDGAVGSYELYVAKNFGAGKLLGAWDANFNGLIDPADEWGNYVDETGASLNPITIGTNDILNATLMIPDGSNANPASVPFVLLAGDITMATSFDDLDASSQVHVAAMKYRPEDDLSVSDIPAIAYDYQTYSGADLTGSALGFTLIAPANTIVYLWAYLDIDGDGIINETGEAVASYNNEPSGRLASGTDSHTDLELRLNTVTE